MDKKTEIIADVLRDCVAVMENDLKGLAVIQPELAQAKKALDELDIVDADFIEWDGKDLPPVGTVCQAWHAGSYQGEVTVLFIGDQAAVLKNHGHGEEQFGRLADYKFRPLRTPEQIAAEEREKAVSEMAIIALAGDNDLINKAWLDRLYDAGYRKTTE